MNTSAPPAAAPTLRSPPVFGNRYLQFGNVFRVGLPSDFGAGAASVSFEWRKQMLYTVVADCCTLGQTRQMGCAAGDIANKATLAFFVAISLWVTSMLFTDCEAAK